MLKLRRRQVKIPSLRIKRSRQNKGKSNEDGTINHQDSNAPISGKPPPTPQQNPNAEGHPLLAEDGIKDASHDWSGAVRQHYLKNMNSMASGRTIQEDDNSSITPIISNCYKDEKSVTPSLTSSSVTPIISNCNKDGKSDITPSVTKIPRDSISNISSSALSTGNISNTTPIISNCRYPLKTRPSSDVSIPPIEESTLYGTEATDESIRNDIITRKKDRMDKLKCAALLEKFVPVIVTILYFVAYILSSYASLSCKFMTVNLDFIPINIKIGQTDLEVGPWAFLALSDDGDGLECLRYPTDFLKIYIVNDSSWKATRACSVLSILIGWIGFLIICVKVSRIEVFVSIRCIRILDTYWKAITIGHVTVLIILDCVMFSFQNVDMCTDSRMWMRDDGKYLAADTCSLSTGAFCSIFAMIFYGFIMILLYSTPFCPLLCEKDRGCSSTTEMSDVERDNFGDQNHIGLDTGYAFIPESSDGSYASIDSFPLDDMNMKGLESKNFSAKPPISFEPNNASCDMGDVEMQQIKQHSGIRNYTEVKSQRQCVGQEENAKIKGLLK